MPENRNALTETQLYWRELRRRERGNGMITRQALLGRAIRLGDRLAQALEDLAEACAAGHERGAWTGEGLELQQEVAEGLAFQARSVRVLLSANYLHHMDPFRAKREGIL